MNFLIIRIENDKKRENEEDCVSLDYFILFLNGLIIIKPLWGKHLNVQLLVSRKLSISYDRYL